MRNIIIVFIGSIILSLSYSCKKGISNYLAKPPGVDVTLDTIFSSKREVQTFVAGLYYYGLPLTVLTPWDSRNRSDGSISGACDEAETTMSWYWTQGWNTGNMTTSHLLDLAYENRWQVIRRANTLIENIDNAPFNDQEFKARVKAEAKFIRAYNYFEMFERYGGIPIVEKMLNLGDTLKIGRSTVEETVNFIINDCDDAIDYLPASYPSNMRGHANKGAALMLKSRTLLFAASPEFNTASPYLSLGDNNKLISYGNYERSRWEKAAEAAKAVLIWAKSAGFHLITDKGVNENYQYIYNHPDNPEVILAQKERGPTYPNAYQGLKAFWPTSFGGPGGITVTFNFVKKYEKKDGTPQIWNPNGGTNLTKLYEELDPRFSQSCGYNRSYWNVDHPQLELWQGGKDAQGCITGVFLRKPIPTALTNTHPVVPNQIEMRLAEAYLNYAEALNEAQGPIQEAYNAINKIRNRSGMPNVPNGLTQDQFRERIRHERAIELAFEGHRIWDVRRWLIANTEGIMKGKMYGIKIHKVGNNEFSYDPYVFEERTFKQRMYLNPFPKSEVNKGYLIQNPGY